MTRNERGIAIITVLLLVAVLTTIISRLALENTVWIRRVENSAANANAVHALRAAQFWVRDVLDRDDRDVDSARDSWALPVPPIEAGSGYISGHIVDLQGRFNLNNLVNQNGVANEIAYDQFRRLLQLLDLDPSLAAAVRDWVDADSEPHTGGWGAEDGYYLGLNPPYRTANRPFVEVAELRLVKGIDARVWQQLEPHICALPGRTSVNVNTATAEVLAAVMSNWGRAAASMTPARRWLKQAAGNPAQSLEEFAAETSVTDPQGELPGGLSVSSAYFLARLDASFDRAQSRLDTVYERSGGRTRILGHRRRL